MMGQTTLIDWTNIPGYIGGTWNPWQGCTKVSAGCKNCYMFRDKKRYGQDPSIVVRSTAATFNLPMRIKERHAWFICSWSDFLHPAADEWRDEAISIIETNPHHLYLILTKRPERAGLIKWHWGKWPENVWFGVTAENQEMADERIPLLLQVPAPILFVSFEPMLGPVHLDLASAYHIDWVINGLESGEGARVPENAVEIAKDLRDQCEVAGIPYFFKQLGGPKKIDGHWGGNLLDGVHYQKFPKGT